MGTFAGSVHFRTEDQKSVLKAARAVSKQWEMRFWVSPALGGWVAVYPEGNGQDLGVGDELAKRTKGAAVQVMVHDSDIFCYRLYSGGKMIDEYNSRPDYFGEPERPLEETRGKPELFAQIAPGKVEEVRRILEEGKVAVFADEELQAFGEALGLSNVACAYEYLAEGETEGVEGWDGFVHVPKARKPLEEAQPVVRGIEQDLAPDVRDRIRIRTISSVNTLTAESGPDGWYVLSREPGPESLPLQHFDRAGSVSTALRSETGVLAFAVSPDRVYLAVAEPGQVLVRDLRTGKDRNRLKIGRTAQVVYLAFSDDSSRLVCVAPNSLGVWDLGAGKRIHEREGSGMRKAWFAPKATHLLIDETSYWSCIPLEGTGAERRIFPGGRRPLTSQQLSDLRNATDPKTQQRESEKIEKLLRKMAPKLGRTQEEVDALLAASREQRQKELEEITSGRRERELRDRALEYVPQVVTSDDGQLLVCGTSYGLRVYNWEQVLHGGEELTEPLHRFDPQWRMLPTITTNVQTVALGPGGGAVAFSDNGGILRRMNLNTGEVSDIAHLGGGIWIRWIGFSADGKQIGLVVDNQVAAERAGSLGTDAFGVLELAAT